MTSEAQKRAAKKHNKRKRAEMKAAGLTEVRVAAYPEDAQAIRERARELREARERVRRPS